MMLESVIVALITGGLSLVGVIMTNISGNRQMENKLVTAQAVTDAKIESLTLEVRRNNDLTSEIPVIKAEVEQLKKGQEDNKRTIESLRQEIKEVAREERQ